MQQPRTMQEAEAGKTQRTKFQSLVAKHTVRPCAHKEGQSCMGSKRRPVAKLCVAPPVLQKVPAIYFRIIITAERSLSISSVQRLTCRTNYNLGSAEGRTTGVLTEKFCNSSRASLCIVCPRCSVISQLSKVITRGSYNASPGLCSL